MSRFAECYSALINSAEQIELCKRSCSLSELLTLIKYWWNCPSLSDNQLLGEIARLNQIPLTPDVAYLAGHWLPYHYHQKTRKVRWLLPLGHAIEPFHDEYISRCRQQLLINQIIQPCMMLEDVLQQGKNLADATPAGFIFHLSRCGSTLLSGCLSELDSTCVFSEPPLLTELLLDKTLSKIERQKLLQVLINLQAAVYPQRPKLIIKWNAWDIFQWDVIRSLYPQVQVVFLVRNPLEILASHQKMPGRHMAGDLSLATLHPVFKLCASMPLVAERVAVLKVLLEEFLRRQHQGVMLDYSHLTELNIAGLLMRWGLETIGDSHTKASPWRKRIAFHSKAPGQVFIADTQEKQTAFAKGDALLIENELSDIYQQLFAVCYIGRGAKNDA